MSSKSKNYYMCCCAIFAALMCILGPISIFIGPVPVSLTNLIIYISIFILGTKGTLISYLIYFLLGLVGLPVFSGFQGGIAKVFGPTGGYLLGFIFIVLISGISFSLSNNNTIITILGMIIGTAIAYLFGTIWFVNYMKCDIIYALSVCVLPFIPFDLIKIIIAPFIGNAVRKPLIKQELI